MKKMVGVSFFFALGFGLVWGWQTGFLIRMYKVVVEKVSSQSAEEKDPNSGYESTGGGNWSGTWQNDKYNSNGRIGCITETINAQRWRAHFTGEFQGEPFSYEIEMEASKKGDRINLEGDADVDGDSYHWDGYIEGNTFIGNFKSEQGNYGQFQMEK